MKAVVTSLAVGLLVLVTAHVDTTSTSKGLGRYGYPAVLCLVGAA